MLRQDGKQEAKLLDDVLGGGALSGFSCVSSLSRASFRALISKVLNRVPARCDSLGSAVS